MNPKTRAMVAYNLWQTGNYTWKEITRYSEHPTSSAALMAARRHASAHDLPLRSARQAPMGEEKIRAAYVARHSTPPRRWADIAQEFGWASAASCQTSVTRWARKNNLPIGRGQRGQAPPAEAPASTAPAEE